MRLRRAAVAVTAATALLLLAGGAAPAGAVDLNPLSDCKSVPPIGSPADGVAGFIDPGPAKPAVVPAGSKATMYDTYGWGGLTLPNYDLGCGPDAARDPMGVFFGGIAQFGMDSLALGVALTTWVSRIAFSPGTVDFLDPVWAMTAKVFGTGVFFTFLALIGGAACVMMVWRARQGKVSSAVGNVGYILGLVAVVGAIVAYPTAFGRTIDRAVTGSIGVVATASANAGDPSTAIPKNPADAVAGNLHNGILYNTWVSANFGRPNSDTAAKYAPKLFDASTISRQEYAETKGDPKKIKELRDKKADEYKKIAKDIQDADPQAYEWLAGHNNFQRAWYVLVGWLSFFASAGMLLLSTIYLLYALIRVRVFIALIPLLGAIALIPRFRGRLVKMAKETAGWMLTVIALCGVSMVYVAVIAAFLAPGTNILLGMIGLAACTLASYRYIRGLMKGYGIMPKRASKKLEKRWKDRDQDQSAPAPAATTPAPSSTTTPAPASATSPGAPPASGTWRSTAAALAGGAAKGAASGAATGAAAAAVTGGASVAAGAAAGAGKGAAAAAFAAAAKAAAQNGHQPTGVHVHRTDPRPHPATPWAAGAVGGRPATSTVAEQPVRVTVQVDSVQHPAQPGAVPAAPVREALPAGPTIHERSEPQVRVYRSGESSAADDLVPVTATQTGPVLIYRPDYNPGGQK